MKLFGYNITKSKDSKETIETKRTKPPKKGSKKRLPVSPPAGRVSVPSSTDMGMTLQALKGDLKFVKPSFISDYIPVIRKLYKVNEDLGSVLYDAIQLTNTGHKIQFDTSIPDKQQEKMKKHLREVSKNWMTGTAGIDGIINKWIAQIYIGGALSIESIPNRRLTGLEGVAMVNPESIIFSERKDGKHHPYQKVNVLYNYKNTHIKLNTTTYKYFGLFSDEDTPYGIPPFMTALNAISTQKDMKDNIHHILNQLGLLGYLEAKLDKPMQNANETEDSYRSRLKQLLVTTKQNVIQGFKEGVVVGYMDDHEFEFHSTTKNLNGVSDLFNMNENQIANGLKTSAAFLGVEGGGAETFLSIVFTKMLSQLKNVQQILAAGLTHCYELELIMAGYDPKGLVIEFKPSTITDDLKLWQAKEIKQRVLHNLWTDRIISSEIYAEGMDYDTPHKIIEPPEPDGSKDNIKKEKREKDKDESDRRVRDKNKPQPKRKDQDTRTR